MAWRRLKTISWACSNLVAGSGMLSLREVASRQKHVISPKVGYTLKRFPRISETFILNEVLELERQVDRLLGTVGLQ